MGVKNIATQKRMDNSVHNTESCIGFTTAITRASDAIQRQRTTVGSHERIGIFRVFGRDARFTALYTAYATSIRCVIPEYKENLDKRIRLLLEDKRANPSNYALVVLSEGAEWEGYKVQEYGEPDAYGHRKRASVAEIHFVLGYDASDRSRICCVERRKSGITPKDTENADPLMRANGGALTLNGVAGPRNGG